VSDTCRSAARWGLDGEAGGWLLALVKSVGSWAGVPEPVREFILARCLLVVSYELICKKNGN